MVKRKLCIQCGDCAAACPVDAVYLDANTEPFVCIQCGKCVPFCPHDCLEMTEVVVEPLTEESGKEVAP
jgi:ferredoxin